MRRIALTRWGVLFGLVAVAGAAMRVWVYRATLGTPNGDEAIVGLMVRHASHGDVPAIFWGQSYGGTQEVLLTVPVFLVTGSGWVALRIVPIVLHAVAVFIVWRVGRRTIGEPPARVAAALFWIWPPFNVEVLVHQHGFYATGVLYCALVLLLALRVVERPDLPRTAVFGLVLGLAFWQTSQIVPIAIAAIGWTVWKAPRSLRYVWVAAPLAVVGAAPWIGWNVVHGWGALASSGDSSDVFRPPWTADGSELYLRSLRLLVSPVAPMMLGLRSPFSAQALLPAAMIYLVCAGLLALFAYGAYRTRGRPASLLYVVAAVFPFVYALGSKTVYSFEPRLIVVVTPVIALLLAQVATTFPRAVALLAVALVVSMVTLHRMEAWFDAPPGQTTWAQGFGPRHVARWVPRDLGPLVATLDRLGLDRVYADYWTAYRLTFDTRERIVATESRFNDVAFEHGQAVPTREESSRYAPYVREVGMARHGFVFYSELVSGVAIVAALERHGYRPYRVGTFVVYAPPS